MNARDKSSWGIQQRNPDERNFIEMHSRSDVRRCYSNSREYKTKHGIFLRNEGHR